MICADENVEIREKIRRCLEERLTKEDLDDPQIFAIATLIAEIKEVMYEQVCAESKKLNFARYEGSEFLQS